MRQQYRLLGIGLRNFGTPDVTVVAVVKDLVTRSNMFFEGMSTTSDLPEAATDGIAFSDEMVVKLKEEYNVRVVIGGGILVFRSDDKHYFQEGINDPKVKVPGLSRRDFEVDVVAGESEGSRALRLTLAEPADDEDPR
jgi:hypothetical protein